MNKRSRNKAIADAYLAGGKPDEIASRFNLTATHVYRILQIHGRRGLVADQRCRRDREIVQRYCSGWRSQVLAKEFGLSRGHVLRLTQLHGVSRSRGARV